MVAISKQPIRNTWITADWDEYITSVERTFDRKVKGYYHNGEYRIEMIPIGNEHSQEHFIINHAISLSTQLLEKSP